MTELSFQLDKLYLCSVISIWALLGFGKVAGIEVSTSGGKPTHDQT